MSFRRRGPSSSDAGPPSEPSLIDILYDSDAEAEASPQLKAVLGSQAGMADTLGPLKFAATSVAGTDSEPLIPSLRAVWDSTGGVETGGLIQIRDLRDSIDAWTDEDNPGANHGSDPDLQVQQGIVLAGGGKRGYMAWDLSSMQGFAEDPANGDITMSMWLSPPVVDVAASLVIRGAVYDTQPWTQAGLTWSNQPEHDDIWATYDYPLLGGSHLASFTLPGVSVADVLGKWVSVYATFEALVAVVGTFTVRAREHTSGPPPRISFNALLP